MPGFDSGTFGPALTEAPVISFDGMPKIGSVDLQSDAFGFDWGITRSWVGLNNSGPVGNGWAINQLPYIVVEGGIDGASIPGGTLWTTSDAPDGSYPDERLSIVEGSSVFTFAIAANGPYDTYAPWGGQPAGVSLQLISGDTPVLRFTDPSGDVTDFYDVPRDGSGRPISQSLAVDPANLYGKFKSYTSAEGSVIVGTSYDGSGNITSMTRDDSTTSESEEFDFSYSSVSNDLVSTAGTTPPELATSIAWKQNGAVIRQAVYDYYTGRLSDGMGGYVNDPNGRLGDLRTVTIEDASGDPISQSYYRYYKLTGESDDITSQGATNDSATTGGPDPLSPALGSAYDPSDPAPSDSLLTSGLKTVMTDDSFARMSAVVPNYQTASDATLQPYVDNFFTYERWADHVGVDGSTEFGSAGYNQNTNYYWRVGYRLGTRYRATEEIAQGAGCSSCSGGEGTTTGK